jgi:hypothetical protein
MMDGAITEGEALGSAWQRQTGSKRNACLGIKTLEAFSS